MTENEKNSNHPAGEKTHTADGKEPKMVFHHEKHAWPARKALGPVLLIVGLLVIVGAVYWLN